MGAMVDRSDRKRVVLAHDWLVGMRGGERVLDRLAQLFGPTDLLTLVSDHRPLSPAIDACRVRCSFLQAIPGASGSLRRALLPLMPLAVSRLRVPPCDLLVSTSSAVIKSLVAPDGAPHLCYCHSPARYIWEQTDDYRRGRGGVIRGAALRAIGGPFRAWDRRTASHVTRFLANSRHTARRIERAFGREASVVHPPVRTDFFTPDADPKEDFLLVVSALEPYKCTDQVIDAANRARLPLRVVGDGSQAAALRARAGSSVTMLGRVDDMELRTLYRRARALIFPQLEDFGIVAAEALACGCPVVAFAAGGALDMVDDGRSGILYAEQTVEALLDAIARLSRTDVSPAECRRSAERFAEAAFDARMLEHAAELSGAAMT